MFLWLLPTISYLPRQEYTRQTLVKSGIAIFHLKIMDYDDLICIDGQLFQVDDDDSRIRKQLIPFPDSERRNTKYGSGDHKQIVVLWSVESRGIARKSSATWIARSKHSISVGKGIVVILTLIHLRTLTIDSLAR